MTARRSIAAGASRDRGEDLERDLLRGYRPPGLYLVRTSPTTRTVLVHGVPTLIADKDGVGLPDFHGAWKGRPFVWDAKATGDDRWELRHLTPTQAEHLDRAQAADVSAGVLLRFDASARVFWLPWPSLGVAWWRWRRGEAARGEASWGLVTCGERGVEVRALRWWEALGLGGSS